jgi:iduronate 2-sulfatase
MMRLFFSLIAFGLVATAAPSKPNVLLICVDDLAAVPSCFGGAAKTPNLDKLATTASVFTRHYVQWPVCGASRASMLGGLRPDSTGIYENGDSWKIASRPETHPTMPYHFRKHGYFTQSFGKIFHGAARGAGYGWSKDPWKLDWTCYVNFQPESDKKKAQNTWRPAVEVFAESEATHNDVQTADRVIAALRQKYDRPFFIAGGFYKPHLPLVVPQKYWDLYADNALKADAPSDLPEGAADFAYNWTEIASYGETPEKLFSDDRDVSDEHARRMRRAYYACVSFIDAQIGRVLDVLEEENLADTTAVVIWSDHGFHLGDHGRWAKHTQFERAMRSPLIVRLPGRHATTGPTNAIAESIDLYPTLCEFAGLPLPARLDGKSLMPVLAGRTRGKAAAFSQIRPVKRKKRELMAYSVRTNEFRYVEWRDRNNANRVVHRELYDHRRDSVEDKSVINNPEFAEILPQLETLVQRNYASLQQ